MEQIKISRSVFPDEQLELNDWLKEFNVSARAQSLKEIIEKEAGLSKEHLLMESYDFTKLKPQDEHRTILSRLKRRKAL